MWDERYSSDDYAYGTNPNEYLVSVIDQIPKGKVLCLAEGEGRNAVYLAENGYDVLAVDASPVGLTKAEKLARNRGVKIATKVIDLAHFEFDPDFWDVVVSIFCHVPAEVRKHIHKNISRGLRSGGVFVLEAYTPDQLKYGTGGPSSEEMMMSLISLQAELEGLKIVYGEEVVREIHEGIYHSGKGAVVQILAVKP